MYCAQSLSTFQVSSSKNKYKCVSLLQYVMLVLCGCFHLQLQTLQPIHCVTTVMLSVSTMLETQLGSVGGKSLICYSVPAPCRCVVATSQILCLLYELCVVCCVFRVLVHIRRMCGYTSICETDLSMQTCIHDWTWRASIFRPQTRRARVHKL